MGNSERTAEGYNPNTSLEPDPVGKPDPEQIEPQLTEMVINRLRDGLGFPGTVRTIDGVIKWMRFVIADAEGEAVEVAVEDTPASPRVAFGARPSTNSQDAAAVGTFLHSLLEQSDLDAPSAFDILGVCMEMAIFLMSKNKAYGDSALDPVRIMSSSDPAEQLRVRMDDKLSRLMRGHADGEDILKDLVGYWVLMRVAEKRAGG